MRIQQDELVVFVERRRLEVEARAVDMGADEIQAVLKRFITDDGEEERLTVAGTVDFRAGLDFLAGLHEFVKILKAFFDSHLEGDVMGKAFRFGIGDIVDVFVAVGVQFGKFVFIELVPSLFTFPDVDGRLLFFFFLFFLGHLELLL